MKPCPIWTQWNTLVNHVQSGPNGILYETGSGIQMSLHRKHKLVSGRTVSPLFTLYKSNLIPESESESKSEKCQ